MTDTGDGFLDSMVERSGDVSSGAVFDFFLGPVNDSSTELSGDAVTRSAFLVVTVSPHLDAPGDTRRGRSCVIATAAIMAMRSSDSSEDSSSVLLSVFAVSSETVRAVCVIPAGTAGESSVDGGPGSAW
jgi:hypothetical protein